MYNYFALIVVFALYMRLFRQTAYLASVEREFVLI